MKNVIKAFAVTILLMSTQTFADSHEDKMKRAAIEQALPQEAPAIESPAPAKSNGNTNHKKTITPEQKAAEVELSFKSSGK